MKLVLDTNTIIAALIKNGISRKIIISPAIQCITPDHTMHEIKRYEQLICKKAQLNQKEFNLILSILFEHISIIPKEKYSQFYNQAKTMIDDVDDAPFVALYLATNADGVWTDDLHFKNQKELMVFRTKELAIAFKFRKK